ncbi:hypothetical protein [Clostridium fessum]|uniref:hypothetical protein n=1 Tax=Clostridium fessum TaxID=2126740 RepID=UPI003999D4D1
MNEVIFITVDGDCWTIDTLCLNKMEEEPRELRVMVERIDIWHKNEIATPPQTMKEADGIILRPRSVARNRRHMQQLRCMLAVRR